MTSHSSALSSRKEQHPEAAETVEMPPRLWLDFVNTDAMAQAGHADLLRDFEGLIDWLAERGAVDEERAAGIRRRAILQPAAAMAALVDARRVRNALRALAERGASNDRVREDAVAEVNRVLGRSAGTRRLDKREDGQYVHSFVPNGDAFAGMTIPIVESAAQSIINDDILRIRRCADPRCYRVFYDCTRNGLRRWCDMGTCGNRAKAARHRARRSSAGEAVRWVKRA